MHEVEKQTAEVDIIAAGINHEAARIVSIAEERARSARTRQSLARFSGIGGDDGPSPDVKRAQLEHEEELALQMATEAEKVREAAAELQRLAREMRGHPAVA